MTAGWRFFLPTHYSLSTTHFHKIKNPASSAGYNHPFLGDSTRCSTYFYPVLVKNLTIGSTSWPSLDSTLGRRFFDPTVMPLAPRGPSYFLQLPLERSATPEPFVSIPTFLNSSSPRHNYFCYLSSAPWTLCKSQSILHVKDHRSASGENALGTLNMAIFRTSKSTSRPSKE